MYAYFLKHDWYEFKLGIYLLKFKIQVRDLLVKKKRYFIK